MLAGRIFAGIDWFAVGQTAGCQAWCRIWTKMPDSFCTCLPRSRGCPVSDLNIRAPFAPLTPATCCDFPDTPVAGMPLSTNPAREAWRRVTAISMSRVAFHSGKGGGRLRVEWHVNELKASLSCHEQRTHPSHTGSAGTLTTAPPVVRLKLSGSASMRFLRSCDKKLKAHRKRVLG